MVKVEHSTTKTQIQYVCKIYRHSRVSIPGGLAHHWTSRISCLATMEWRKVELMEMIHGTDVYRL